MNNTKFEDGCPYCPDLWLVLSVIVLMLVGVAIQFALWGDCLAVSDRMIPPVRQVVHLFLATVAALLAWRVPVKRWFYIGGYAALLFLVLLMMLLFGDAGREIHGSTRAIELFWGWKLAPATFMPLLIVFLYAPWLESRYESDSLPLDWLSGGILVLSLLLVIALPHLTMGVILMVLISVLLWMSRHHWGWSVSTILLWIVGLTLVVFSNNYWHYQFSKIGFSMQEQFVSTVGDNYQSAMAQLSMVDGGWFGQSELRVAAHLPEASADFFFATAVEGVGVVGGMLIIGVITVLLWRMTRIAQHAAIAGLHPHALMVWGIIALIGSQTLLHLLINVGLLPPAGVVLPFMSLGGSHLLVEGVAVGVTFRVAAEVAQSEKQ